MSDAEAHLWKQLEIAQRSDLEFCDGALAIVAQNCPTPPGSPSEDALGLLQLNANTGWLAVADGVGGANAGGRASSEALDRLVASCEHWEADQQDPDRGLRVNILDAIEQANREIISWGIGAATTLVVIEYTGGFIRTYHAGDSSAVLIGGRGKLKYQTVGHAPVAQAVDIGWIDEADALHHEDRHLITNCLGTSTMRIEIGPTLEMAPRDTLLVASDGLFDNVSTDEICQRVGTGRFPGVVEELGQLALERMESGRDDDTPSKPDDLSIIGFQRGES